MNELLFLLVALAAIFFVFRTFKADDDVALLGDDRVCRGSVDDCLRAGYLGPDSGRRHHSTVHCRRAFFEQ
ncbi:hypothetical protein PanWU01x14_341560 [Parasponia andersonii]|uniref:Rapid ALkalinization Factor n=1 Tax=Parasponia andersonii TaxID=3476 RepID=A0A2P5AE53_PARAD|nr:hypothetical protein PanWU01x14_341560 [Parasponia andersonii]